MSADMVKSLDAARPTAMPPLGWVGTGLIFGGAGLLLFAATHVAMPALESATGLEPVLLWFASGGLGVFLPMLLVGGLLLWQEDAAARKELWRERLRFRSMTIADWLWSVAGLVAIGLLGGGTLAAMRLVWGDVPMHPSFMTMKPLGPDRYWILAVWLPFWLLNIFGEEFLWRGVILPRQEAALGRWAWLLNGAGWFLFHLAFGPIILLTLWPIIFILPYLVQRQKNSWIGVVIHGGLNGPGFIAVAFGLV